MNGEEKLAIGRLEGSLSALDKRMERAEICRSGAPLPPEAESVLAEIIDVNARFPKEKSSKSRSSAYTVVCNCHVLGGLICDC